MQVLPIVERELRVAVRQPKTWWRRVTVMCLGLAVFIFCYLVVGRWAAASLLGREIFSALGGFGLIYALLAGPLATVDSISRERREGTLGLLFLTNLRTYDVILGKIAAASFDMVLGLITLVPLLALPLLMGGITLFQFARLVCALGNVTFLSLALGICVSAICTNSRAALALLVAAIFLLTFGPPFIVEGIGNIPHTTPAVAFLYAACPLYTIELCLSVPFRHPAWKFWLNMGGLQGLAWICVGIACLRTMNAWREVPALGWAQRWREWWEKWRREKPATRLRWRQSMLEGNPIRWLEGRDRLQERMLWALFLGVTIVLAAKHLHSSDSWPREDFVILWAWWAHCVLCFWIALQAPRRLADDKQSGALELLLCTSLSPRAIIRGNMQALQRRYGRVFFGLMALDAFLLYGYFSSHGGWEGYFHHDAFQLSVVALLAFPLQAYSVARLGLFNGLVQSNSLRASFATIWKAGVLPWVIFFIFILACDLVSRRFKSFQIDDTFAFNAWAGAHVLPCTIFLIIANRELKKNFRLLALAAVRPRWWQRWPRRRKWVRRFDSP